jgi:ribosomal protein L22
MELAKVTIELSPELVVKIADDIRGTSYKSVEHFIQDVIEQKYPELRKRDYTEEEEEVIRERLRKLGYIE